MNLKLRNLLILIFSPFFPCLLGTFGGHIRRAHSDTALGDAPEVPQDMDDEEEDEEMQFVPGCPEEGIEVRNLCSDKARYIIFATRSRDTSYARYIFVAKNG